MRIGIPKEILPNENRVAATPDTVAKYRKLGFEVVVEANAGAGAFADDAAYIRSGATVTVDVNQILSTSDVVLKVKQPIFNPKLQRHEADMLNPGCLLMTFLHPAAPSSHAMIEMLRARGITAFTMDSIPRISRAQKMDALTSMSMITGYKAVLMAASRLPVFVPMSTTSVGTLKPARFLVVGAGVVGLQALATAKRLGGTTQAIDIRSEARDACKSLGASVAGFEVPPELATGAGGYAQALHPDWLEKERQLIATLLGDIDVVVLSALVPGEEAPLLITMDMVHKMKPGSIIVDVSIDQGGNCRLTKPGEIIDWQGITAIGVQNIPGSVPVHASFLYANNLFGFIENLFKKGPGVIDWDDEIVRSTLVTRDGKILHAGLLKALSQANGGAKS